MNDFDDAHSLIFVHWEDNDEKLRDYLTHFLNLLFLQICDDFPLYRFELQK